MKGRRRVWGRWLTRYPVLESLPRSAVPAEVFRPAIPKGVPITADYHVSADQAARMRNVPLNWLGPTWNGLELTPQPRISEQPFRFRSEPSTRTPLLGGHADIMERADAERPRLAERWLEAEYALASAPPSSFMQQGRDLKVISTRRIPLNEWTSPRGSKVSSLTVNGRSARLATMTTGSTSNGAYAQWTLSYLIVDMGDSTVLLQGIDISRRDLERAARGLRRAVP